MKRRILILALAFAAVTAAIGTTVAALLPASVDVYVRVDEANPTPLKYVGTFDIPAGTTTDVVVNVLDTRTNTTVQRKARNSSGTIIKAPTAVVLTATTTIP
jgi:hypothetical protein